MFHRPSSPFALTALIATLGCTKALPPLTPPEAGGPQWREMVSKHVVLRTDRDEEDAREALVELEHTVTALHDLAFPQVDIDGSRIVAVHFARERDYDSFYRAGTAGMFLWRLPNDLDPEPTMVLWGTLDAAARATLQHELTHMFVRSSVAGLPPWLSEGIAEYYETLAVEDGYAYIGRPMLTSRAWPQTAWRSERTGAFMTTLVPIGYVPKVADMVEMDQAAFYVWTDQGRQPTLEEQRKAAANYLGAFGLVHLLMHEPAYQTKYDDMMVRLAQGAAAREAWSAAFAEVKPDELELAYRKHLLNRYETMVLRTAYQHKEVAVEANRAMAPADVHVLWARLRPWRGDTSAARADIDAARRLSPSSAEARFWRGVFNYRQHDLSEAAADMEAAIAAQPNEPRYLQGLAIVRREVSAEADKAQKQEAKRTEDEVMARLGKVAKTGAELNTVADHHERRGRWDDALAFAQRAVKADPACWTCFSSLGEILFAKQQYQDAARAQTIALSLLPDGVEAPDEDQKLRKYIEAARKQPADAPAAPGASGTTPAGTGSPAPK
jgi:tetratricopeptide (TPR) repeat protein